MKQYLVLFLASFLLLASPAMATKHPRKTSTTSKTRHKYNYTPPKWKGNDKSEPVKPHKDKNGHLYKGYKRHPKGTAPHY